MISARMHRRLDLALPRAVPSPIDLRVFRCGGLLGRLSDGKLPTAPDRRAGLVSFVLEQPHAHDVAQLLDLEGIAVRAGHHCTWPLHDRLGIAASTRASFYIYNTAHEVARLASGLREVRRLFGR